MVARYEGRYCIVLRLNGITGFVLRSSLNTELIRGSGSYRTPKNLQSKLTPYHLFVSDNNIRPCRQTITQGKLLDQSISERGILLCKAITQNLRSA